MSTRLRRRSKPSLVARLRVFWIFITAGLIVAACGAYALANWSIFDPASIVVEGERRVQAGDILARAAIPKDRNVWLIDKKAAQQRIEAIPWIATARIHRSLPAAVHIVVTERKPVACVEAGAARYLVDDAARVLEVDCPAGGLPGFAWPAPAQVAAGASLDDPARLKRMAQDAATVTGANLDPEHLGFDRFDGLEVQLRGGPLVRFGDDQDLADKVRLVEPILRTYGDGARELLVIDLRAPSTPVVEKRNQPKT